MFCIGSLQNTKVRILRPDWWGSRWTVVGIFANTGKDE